MRALEDSGFPAPPGLAAAYSICVKDESSQAQVASGSQVKGTDREPEGKFAWPGSVSLCFPRTPPWLCSCQKQGNRFVAAFFVEKKGTGYSTTLLALRVLWFLGQRFGGITCSRTALWLVCEPHLPECVVRNRGNQAFLANS